MDTLALEYELQAARDTENLRSASLQAGVELDKSDVPSLYTLQVGHSESAECMLRTIYLGSHGKQRLSSKHTPLPRCAAAGCYLFQADAISQFERILLEIDY